VVPERGRDHTHADADRGLPINTPTAGHCPRGIEPRATPFNTKHLFLISPELVNQFILILILIRRPRRIAMLILDPGTLDFLAPSINYN
jgi:hypothetical protein